MPDYHGWTHRPRSQGGTDPISISGQELIEYAVFTKTNASLSTSLTAIPWSASIDGEYDTDTPTFDVNGSNNVEIAKEGYYRVEIQASGWSLTSSVNSVLWLRAKRLSGASVSTAAGLYTGSGEVSSEILHYDSQGAGEFDFETSLWPSRSFGLILTQAALDGAAAPHEMQIAAYVEEDLAGVSHAESDWSMMIVRVGPVWVAA